MIRRLLESIWTGIGWTLAIFFLLSMDTHDIITTPGFFDKLQIDKLIHFLLFGAYSVLWGSYIAANTSIKLKPILILLIVSGSLYGLGMEFYQKFFTDRMFSIWDAVADAVGAVAGAAVIKKKPLWK
jgi:hypothetical protein